MDNLLHHDGIHLHPVTSSGIPLPSIGRILNSMLDLMGDGDIEGTVAVSLTMIVFRKAVKCVVNDNFSGSAGLPGITVKTGPLKTDDIGLIQHKIMKPERFHLVAPGGVCHGRCPLDMIVDPTSVAVLLRNCIIPCRLIEIGRASCRDR